MSYSGNTTVHKLYIKKYVIVLSMFLQHIEGQTCTKASNSALQTIVAGNQYHSPTDISVGRYCPVIRDSSD